MTSAQILTAIAAHLTTLVTPLDGSVELSGTPQSTLDLLKSAPTRWRCIVQWQRETQLSRGSAMRMRFLVIIQQPKGLSLATPAKANVDTALLTRLDQVIDMVRSMKFVRHDIDGSDLNPKETAFLVDPEFPSRQAYAAFELGYGRAPVVDVTVAL